MKTVRFAGNSTVTIVDIARPVPGANEVLIKVTRSAICGSDLPPYQSPEPTTMPIGHEMIGEVVEAGGGCRVEPGARVASYALRGCGVCPACVAGDVPFCINLSVVVGGHSEYVVVPESCCLCIPEDIPDDAAVLLLADTMGVAYHANKHVDVQPGEWVLVAGVGPVGLGAVALMAHKGANTIAVDRSHYRLNLALELGAAVAMEADDNISERIASLTSGRGCDVGMECAGRETTLNLVLDSAAKGGRVAICGEQKQAAIRPSEQLIRKELQVVGSWYFRPSEAEGLLALYRTGLQVERMITHRYPLDQAAEAHVQFASGESGKVVLLPS